MVAASEEWVQIQNAEHTSLPYYWNRRTQETSNAAVATVWGGKKDTSLNRFYFWRICTEETVWVLPQLGLPEDSEPSTASAGPVEDTAKQRLFELGTSDPDSCWVKIEGDAPYKAEEQGSFALHGGALRIAPYFWNFALGASMPTLPPGKLPRFTAHESPAGDGWYYKDVTSGTTTWEIPCRCPAAPTQEMLDACASATGRWLEAGAPVCIRGLKMQARFNNQVGVIVDATSERCLVRLPAESSELVLALRPANIAPLPGGSLVELLGLKMKELNGMVGTVQSTLVTPGEVLRYIVRLADGSPKSLKGANLKPRCRLWNIGEALASANQKPAELKWRDEHDCIFIDSQGQHRHFFLHLPRGDGSESVKWPLLVYMHGAGGGTFFTHSKKSIKTAGMLYAARTFAVITPRCDWTWRDAPSDWVIELLESCQALDWLDHRRVYMTGCSMGGMSAWELAALRPDLLAAVAPVAAHHKKEKTAWIAQRLSSTPLYTVHDKCDEVCPMAAEQDLWQLLLHNGHSKFKNLVTTGIDHCKIHEQAYCVDEQLYHWLLQWSRTEWVLSEDDRPV